MDMIGTRMCRLELEVSFHTMSNRAQINKYGMIDMHMIEILISGGEISSGFRVVSLR